MSGTDAGIVPISEHANFDIEVILVFFKDHGTVRSRQARRKSTAGDYRAGSRDAEIPQRRYGQGVPFRHRAAFVKLVQ